MMNALLNELFGPSNAIDWDQKRRADEVALKRQMNEDQLDWLTGTTSLQRAQYGFKPPSQAT